MSSVTKTVHYFHHDRDQNRIFVSTDDGVKDDRFRYLPSARWLPSKRIWSLVATPMVAERVVLAAGQDPVDMTKSFGRLMVKGSALQYLTEPVKEALDLAPPPIRKYDPWLHQLRAYHFVTPLPAAMLAMDMGTGKTKVVYDRIQNDPSIKTVLVACPKAAIVDVWQEQFKEHWAAEDGTPGVLALDEGSRLERANRAYSFLCSDVRHRKIIVVNYDILWHPTFGDLALSGQWDLVVLDESHRIKRAGGTMSKYVFRLGEKAAKRMCLTGTPMPQTPLDIYGQYRFLDAGIFGTNKQKFDLEYAIKGGYNNHEIIGYQNQEELNRKFYSIAFRVTDDVLDLPTRHTIERKTSLEPAARRIYDVLDKEYTVAVQDDSITSKNVLVKHTRLQQLTSGRVKMDSGELKEISSAKQDLFADVLEDLAIHEPLVVFARFHQDIDNVRKIATRTGRSVGELSSRANDLAAWKRGEMDLLAVQISSGSESIDLTRANYAIYYSVSHSLKDYTQSAKRLHRPKQKRPVTFIHLLARATIDIDIMWALRHNKEIVDHCLAIRKKRAA